MDKLKNTMLQGAVMDKIFISDFCRSAARLPDKTALVCRGETLSYAELDERASRIARGLLARGMGRGRIVPLLMERGPDAVAAMLGVWKAGAALSILSPAYPRERIERILGECAADTPLDADMLREIEHGASAAASGGGPELPGPASPDDTALVVFTSGSTGQPKGVLLPHRSLGLAVRGNARFFEESDRSLSVASFSFIAVAVDILAPLTAGATVHIAPEGMRRDLPALAAYALEQGIDITFMPPQSAAQFLPAVKGRLRCLMTGSERVRRLWSDSTRIVNLYGASETCGPVCAFTLDRAYEDAPLGLPYPGSAIVLLDDAGRRVRDGEEGEICVSGQIASGYLNMPELTADRFVPNPLAEGEHDRVLYRSGDLGRVNPDGLLEYVQRKDWMLKVRGYRVEPGEIEAVMLRETPVNKAVVVGFESLAPDGAEGGARLYACYTADKPVAPAQIRDILSRFLPEYMLPAFMEQVETLPLNENGKVDRTKIAPPDAERWKNVFEAPADETEAALCAAFGQVLGVGGVGALDDFAALGGDSVAAVKVLARIPGTGLTVADILGLRTPRALAGRSRAGSSREPLPLADDRESWPLTFAERQMAVEQSLDPESMAYNVSLAFSLSGALDERRLERALHLLPRRHRILTSYYPSEHGEFVHRIFPAMTLELDRAACSPDALEARIRELNKPFDLAGAPLCRFTLFDLGGGERVLHLLAHHIIIDGMSGALLFDELWRLYENEAALPPEPARPDYLDYAAWLEAHGDALSSERFFLDMFADGVPENEMPTRPLRPERLPFVDQRHSLVLDFDPLEGRARRLGVTPYALLMAAAGMMLGKYCGSEDVVLGAAMNGRGLPETADMAGMFVNTLPLRLKPEGDLRLEAFIRDTAALLGRVQAKQTCPFERLVPALAPERNASRSPVFDLIVNYLEAMPDYQAGGLTVRRLPLRNQELAIDLMLEMTRQGGALHVELSYAGALYEGEVVRGMLEQFGVILERMAGGDDMPLADAAELPESQRRRLLHDFAGPRVDDSLGRTVVDMFRERARALSANRAVVFRGEALSYAELDAWTDRLAAALAERGAGKGATVGVLVPRGPLMVAGALGVLKTGAAYVPLDPGYPSERLEFMLEDAGAALVIADRSLTGLLPGYAGALLYADEAEALKEAPAPALLPASPEPGDLLVLLYTSGTTGKPKGVMLTHANLANFCFWYARNYALEAGDGVAAYASFGFDACLMDLYPALTHGACVHVIPEEMRLDLPGLNEYFNENGVTLAFVTTQLGRQFAESMPNRSLRALSVGGESLVPLVPPAGYALYNAYGPTECTIFTTLFRIDRLYERVPLGKPLDNTALYIVDKRGRLAPVGAAGELCIAGRQVAAGYLNRPDLTAEKFTPNPFSDEPDYARMYCTGDVARWLPGGDIDFVGRRDFQVKIRGFRVELTEIEGRIRLFPGVSDAAVVPADAPGGGKCAVAYVVFAEGALDAEALARFIEEQLPPYMVPASTMQVERIPLNPNGKVDRRKLPAPVFGGAGGNDAEAHSSRSGTEMERLLAGVLTEVLGHDQFEPGSNLLRAGLTSLTAIKLAARLDAHLGVAPAAREIMREPTLLGLENAVVRALLERAAHPPLAEGPAGTDLAGTDPAGTGAAGPLSQSQAGVCFDCLKRPEALTYNVPFRLSLPSSIDASRLAEAVAAVIDAHPAVKGHLAMDGERILQTPGSGAPATVPCADMEEKDLAEFSEAFVRPFNLFEGPLWRAQVLRTPQRVVLLADFHHVLFDGGSLDIFLRELGTAYENGGLPAAQRERLSIFDWARLEEKREGSAAWQEDKAYFDAQLKDFEGASALAADVPHTGRAGALQEVVRPAEAGAVEAFCAAHGVTPAALFLAATGYAVGRWTQSPSVFLATISSGRSDPRLQNSFGMFVRTLPLALRLGEGASALDYARAAQGALSDAVAHEGYPFTRIADEYAFEPAIMYACELGVTGEYHVGGQAARLEGLARGGAKFKISVHIEERDGVPAFAVQYDDALYSRDLMERFADTLARALEAIMAAPGEPVRALSLLSPEQRRRLESFNATQGELPEPVLHRMFEAAVRDNPQGVALIAEDGEYTYERLDREANRLANALLALGVRPEERVAFLLRRTGRVLVAMLGILKAGCAYIPIDPEYPDERITHVLEDSGARYLLGEADLLASPGRFAGALDIDALRREASDLCPAREVSPGHLAYLIYTSGSTGKPKGVMIEHRGIANYVTAHPLNRHVHALVKDARSMMSITTVAFDMFLKESMTALCNGLTLVFAGDEASKDPVLMADLFEATGADAFNTTPSRMLEYTEYPALLRAIRSCKVIMAGAEKYPEALLSRLRGGHEGGARLFNTYGPTEITVSCNGKELTGSDRVTVGAPLLNVREFVVDADGNLLPPGMVGELLVGGWGVARGYINLPEQTAERFAEFQGERVYRTGDYARWTADGEIEILGRNDNQIKLRGLRIELGEIEKAVLAVPGVKACAVAIRRMNHNDQLCAWYLADEPVEPLTVREELARTLAPYMLPTAYLQIAAMPKTPNGKNDLRALPDAQPLRLSEYEAPQGALEEIFCAIFAKVLGLEQVGAQDGFFDIGGSSLAVTRIIIEARERGVRGKDGATLAYGDVFANPTPRELAALLDGGGTDVTPPQAETDYDYAPIHELLTSGTLQSFRDGKRRDLGSVLLTGATGFLGAHVLHSLLSHEGEAVYCLLRRGRYESVETRLKHILYYYFEDNYDEHFGGRIIPVEGDVTDRDCLERLGAFPIETIINCAANVTHFAKGTGIADVNTGGVLNLVELALARQARLIQISTTSVAGFSVDGVPPKGLRMNEGMLFFGQNLENQYVHSKFMAERAVLEAVRRGLDAKIMRVGNLMARSRDGEFQINSRANSFIGRLRAYEAVGCFPYSSYLHQTELAPIDSTARAILLLAQAPAECRIFHPYNNHMLYMGDIVAVMREEGIPIDMVEDAAFDKALSAAMKDKSRAEHLVSLIAYQNVAQGRAAVPVGTDNEYTTQALLRMNWRWPETNEDYLRKFLQGLIGLGFFGME